MTEQESPDEAEVDPQSAANEAAKEYDDSIPTPDHDDDNEREDAHAPTDVRGEVVREAEGKVAE